MATTDIQTMANYTKWYYILHGYARCEYYLDDMIPFVNKITPDDFKDPLYIDHYNHRQNEYYEWVLIANKEDMTYPMWSLGWHYETQTTDYGICIFDYALTYNAGQPTGSIFCNWAKMILLHEFGHHAGIVEEGASGQEIPCSNVGCCMAEGSDDSAVPEPWYCSFHWSLREDPFE